MGAHYRLIITHADLLQAARALAAAPGALARCAVTVTSEHEAVTLRATPLTVQRTLTPATAAGTLFLALVDNEHAATLRDDLLRANPAALIAVLVLSRPASPVGQGLGGLLSGVRRPLGSLEPLVVQIVGPSMPRFGAGQPLLSHDLRERFSRLLPALGLSAWQRLHVDTITIVGCGRSGSLVATSLARLGVNTIGLIDPDRLEPHNLDAMDGVCTADLGRLKVEAISNALGAIWPAGQVRALPCSITAITALPLVRSSNVLICCVDDDGPRWAAGVLAALYLLPLLDIGVGVFGQGATRQLGADVRLILPGDGCLLCCGGVARPAQVVAQQRPGAEEGARPQQRLWSAERTGSLRSLNQIATGFGMRLLEDLYSGHLDRSRWLQCTGDAAGHHMLVEQALTRHPACPLCRYRGQGERGLVAAAAIDPATLSALTPTLTA